MVKEYCFLVNEVCGVVDVIVYFVKFLSVDEKRVIL